MERERIERLAIDSAGGELNADTKVLFKAYLAEHPEANRWAEDMLRIYEKTEAAISTKTKDVQPNVETEFVFTKPILRPKWRLVGRWAAVLIFAIGVGFTAGRWSGSSEPKPIAVAKLEGPRMVSRTVLDLRKKYEGSFWGEKILASTEPMPYPKRAEYKWNGKFWPNIRQYIKEKYYE